MSALAYALPVWADRCDKPTSDEGETPPTPPQPQPPLSKLPAFPLIPDGVEPSSFSPLTTASPVKCGFMDKDTVRKNVFGLFPNAGRHIESWKVIFFMAPYT